jgi:uncharacterized protein DUF3616
MNITGSVHLQFNQKLDQLNKKKKLRDGLSAAIQTGNNLWVANDETISLERLSFDPSGSQGIYSYSKHESFQLNEYLELPAPPPPDLKDIEEADVEGMDFKDGYLWLVGSHSLKRKKVDQEDSIEKNFKRLANVSSDGNRFLLARIPLIKEGESYTLKKAVEQEDGKKKTAAQLHGDAASSLLTRALMEDEHLKKFLSISGKDNGFDIEGLAVAGNRVFIGLRGPVLRGWAVLLELELEVDDKKPSRLVLKSINPNNLHNPRNPSYRKHFLELEGLGVRDLCVQDSDLLILAGPTMDLDGPVNVFRWEGGAKPAQESLIFKNALINLGSIPYGQDNDQGKDHAESMTLFSPDGSKASSLLVTYDSASDSRKLGKDGVKADVFALPA